MSMVADGFKILFGKLPGQLVIQATNYCNGSCPQCGMRKSADIRRLSLSADKIKETISQCAENNFEAVSLTGGEPFLDLDMIMDLLDFAGSRKIPYIRSGTNGYMFADSDIKKITDFADRLSATKIRNFWISMDSADTETHETMRGLPAVVSGIKQALPIFHERGLYPAVNLGINRNISGRVISSLTGKEDSERFFNEFKDGFKQFFAKVIDLGFTMANVCYPMSSGNEELDNPAYGAISADFIVSFSDEELKLVFRALLETIPLFRDKIRIFTPLSVLYAMAYDHNMLFPCLGGVRYFYMDSRDGNVYPCGFLGDCNLGENLNEALKKTEDRKASCSKCHWECFKDPSQLFGIGRFIFYHPIRVFIKKELSPEMINLWFSDLRYYIKNDFFNGRKAPKQLKTSVNNFDAAEGRYTL